MQKVAEYVRREKKGIPLHAGNDVFVKISATTQTIIAIFFTIIYNEIGRNPVMTEKSYLI